ncbi:WG repeat-containing protein, partial [Clostridium perfringens]|uniref:WG repeat-containing protein n=1 Tax=Clostridium perfringens TaxID=1502 RepID=UPI003905CFFC
MNKDKNIIIPFKFNIAYDFNNYGVAIVLEDSIFRLIDTKGNYISTEKYESINPYKENRAVYVQNSKMGVLDEKGYK